MKRFVYETILQETARILNTAGFQIFTHKEFRVITTVEVLSTGVSEKQIRDLLSHLPVQIDRMPNQQAFYVSLKKYIH